MLLIGSRALNYRLGYAHRKPVDWDFVCTYEEYEDFIKNLKRTEAVKACYPINSGRYIVCKTDKNIYEFEIAWEGSSAEGLLLIAQEDFNMDLGYTYASLDVLYLLKMSHRFKKDSQHFKKTMDDILLMREKGAIIRPEHEGFLKAREKATYTNKLPSLMRSKENFFGGDGIIYEWDHDSLHEALKHLDKPAYQYFSGGEVWSDMKVFVTLPEEIKLYAVLEESLVLASERSQLAFNPAPDTRWSFEFALSKVCTSITGGIFRSYAWENYYKVIDLFNKVGYDYMDRVRAGITNGVVIKLGKKDEQI